MNILIIIYILGVIFTYGYAYKAMLTSQNEEYPECNNKGDASALGVICSIIWPIYWPFHLSRLLWEKYK